jgi:uroporphyrinogen decarboxylase
MANPRFTNALARIEQPTPPIWMMRQAGRYHRHYQALRAKHSFVELCKIPELAAEVTWGPIQDFDFDVAILFSDLLFPLEAFGMGLEYGDGGPELGWHLEDTRSLTKLASLEDALPQLAFQKAAVQHCRAKLPESKSLIGFVGGPWTLFCYAAQGKHDGTLIEAKKKLPLFEGFCEKLVPLLIRNIELQFEGGAELVMVFDTAAGEISPGIFQSRVAPQLAKLAAAYPGKLGYYSRGTTLDHLRHPLFMESEGAASWAGLGMDHRWDLLTALSLRRKGFQQGNFDQALLHSDPAEFKKLLLGWLEPLERVRDRMGSRALAGWVCGLGHGVLPKTPEENVRCFVQIVRERFR